MAELVREIEACLLRHERRKRVFFDHHLSRFVVWHDDAPIPYRGLHRLMREAFFPDFDEKEVRRSAKRGRGSRPDPETDPRRYRAWLEREQAPKGARGGGVVHAQLDAMVRGLNGGAAGGPRQPRFEEVWSQDHPWFSRLRDEMRRLGYVPLESEVGIFDEYLGYATQVDLLAYDPGARCVRVIEIKTGYEGGVFERSTGPMKGPLSALLPDNSHRSQALAQALLPVCTLWRHYGGIRCAPEVWHVCDSAAGVRRHEIRRSVLTPAVLDLLYLGCLRHVHALGLKTPCEQYVKRHAGSIRAWRHRAEKGPEVRPAKKVRVYSLASRPFAEGSVSGKRPERMKQGRGFLFSSLRSTSRMEITWLVGPTRTVVPSACSCPACSRALEPPTKRRPLGVMTRWRLGSASRRVAVSSSPFTMVDARDAMQPTLLEAGFILFDCGPRVTCSARASPPIGRI